MSLSLLGTGQRIYFQTELRKHYPSPITSLAKVACGQNPSYEQSPFAPLGRPSGFLKKNLAASHECKSLCKFLFQKLFSGCAHMAGAGRYEVMRDMVCAGAECFTCYEAPRGGKSLPSSIRTCRLPGPISSPVHSPSFG